SGFAKADDAATEAVARASALGEHRPIIARRPHAASPSGRDAGWPGDIEGQDPTRSKGAIDAPQQRRKRPAPAVVEHFSDCRNGVALGQASSPDVSGHEFRARCVHARQTHEIGRGVYAKHVISAIVQYARPSAATASEVD